MDREITDVPEQPAGSSINGKAEQSYEVQIDPNPKATSILSNWVHNLKREERTKPMQGQIHRVPSLHQEEEKFRSNYQPKVVSLGPYHFGEVNLSKFQELKRPMANELLMPDKGMEASLRYKISKNIGSLMDAYSSEKMRPLEQHVYVEWEEMLFLDGCFVLQFILCVLYNRVEDLKIKRYDIDAIHNDLFLAENQLPFQLLKILSGNDPKLLDLVDDYIYTHKISNNVDRNRRQDEPVHLLDRLRTIIIGGPSETRGIGQWPALHSTPPPGTKSPVLWNAKELAAKGIHLKTNRTGLLKDIFFGTHFTYGTLSLPRMIVDYSTRSLFSNLAAYEMCADVGSTITSYIFFMDSLANHAEDIKELESAGVLVNRLATDETAADLFKEMSQALYPDTDAYMDVKEKIGKFLEHETKASIASWIAESYHNHFKTPLSTMAIVAISAASLALVLTIIQTYFAIFPRDNK